MLVETVGNDVDGRRSGGRINRRNYTCCLRVEDETRVVVVLDEEGKGLLVQALLMGAIAVPELGDVRFRSEKGLRCHVNLAQED